MWSETSSRLAGDGLRWSDFGDSVASWWHQQEPMLQHWTGKAIIAALVIGVVYVLAVPGKRG